MSTMIAYRIRRFGGPAVVQSERIDIPVPGAGEVLVRVQVASANPVDIKTDARGPLPIDWREQITVHVGPGFCRSS